MISPLSHAMSTNLVNPCLLNVILSVYMIFRVEICFGSLKLEVFEGNGCFTRFYLSWPAGHAICRHGDKLKNRKHTFLPFCRQGGKCVATATS
jgi:hypothetical protein